MAWTHRFVTMAAVTGGTAPGANDGKDTVGFNLSGATWTASTRTLVKTNAFTAYTPTSAGEDYIFLSSATAGTDGVYPIQSKTDNSTIVCGAVVIGTGIAADQTDVASGTGPWGITDAISSVAAGMLVNVKAGAYANMSADYTFSTAGSTTQPIWWRGYQKTIGDLATPSTTIDGSALSTVGTPSYRPLFNADTSTDQIVISGAHQWFSNIDVTSICTDSGGAVNASGGNLRFIRCRIENTANNTAARAMTTVTNSPVTLIGCRLKAHTGATRVLLCGAKTFFHGCHVIGGKSGVEQSGNAVYVSACLINGFTTTGILNNTATVEMVVSGCSIASTEGSSIGVSFPTIPTQGICLVINCIISCVTGISAGSATNGVTLFNNHFVGCTNNLTNIQEIAAYNDPLGTACLLIDDDTTPWTGGSPVDYSLVASNAVDKGRAYPIIFPYITGTDAAMTSRGDIGAVQHVGPANNKVATTDYDVLGAAGTAASGGGLMINPGLSGGLR